jgi:hypothetical protein
MVITNFKYKQYFSDDYYHKVIQYVVEDYHLEKHFREIYNIDIENIDEEWSNQKMEEQDELIFEKYIDISDSPLIWILTPLFDKLKGKYMFIKADGHHQEYLIIVELEN